ncbi:hypothetical protein [Ralstonia sp. 24A2]|uniref:hypothetical protein n=1 Tax=Ralstonia sp. 24A2 TaxID=3447364 RepID=UPI003F694EE6
MSELPYAIQTRIAAMCSEGNLMVEQGDCDKATDKLTRAYMGAGLDIFLEDDPKYLGFLETKIKL